MSEENKIVGLDGKAISPRGQTPKAVWDLFEEFRGILEGDTYTSVAIVVVGADGLAVTARSISPGQANATLGALTYIQHRITRSMDGDDAGN